MNHGTKDGYDFSCPVLQSAQEKMWDEKHDRIKKLVTSTQETQETEIQFEYPQQESASTTKDTNYYSVLSSEAEDNNDDDSISVVDDDGPAKMDGNDVEDQKPAPTEDTEAKTVGPSPTTETTDTPAYLADHDESSPAKAPTFVSKPSEDEAISEITGTTGNESMEVSTPDRRPTAKPSSPMAVDSPSKSAPRPLPKHKKKMTIAEILDSYRQVNMEGLPSQAHIFDFNLQSSYSGPEGGSVADMWLKVFIDTITEAIANSDDGIKLLPIDDSLYHDTELWISSEDDVANKIKSFRDLPTYTDMDYGNSPYFTTNSNTGEKKWQTRIRVGFDIGIPFERVQHYLHNGIRAQGRNAGCYDSPLQCCPIEKVGSICFLVKDINVKAFEKELHRKFGWKIPMAIRWGWVTMPYTGRSKWNQDSPGLMQYHIYVPLKHAKTVDAEMRKWFHPSTPKKDQPWAGTFVYISDWRAAQKGTISVKAYGPVKDHILTMVSKARDFQNLTEVIYFDTEIHGMLKQAPTTNFGSSTLLKLLLSIKAKPTQADAAKKAATQVSQPSAEDPDSDNDTVGGVGFKKVKSSKRKKREKQKEKKQQEEETLTDLQEAGMTKAQAKAARRLAQRLLRDQENNRPCPLFLFIGPGEMEGTFIAVCRIRFVALGRNVASGIIAFLIFHLRELNQQRLKYVLSKWFPMSLILYVLRSGEQWSPPDLCTRRIQAVGSAVDGGLEFLDDSLEDPTDVFDGTLEIDLEMADAKDIDDGATVAGALDEIRERETQLEDAFQEIEVKEQQLYATNVSLNKEREENMALKAEIARLKAAARVAAAQPTPAPTPASSPAPEAAPSPDPQETDSTQDSTQAPTSPNEPTAPADQAIITTETTQESNPSSSSTEMDPQVDSPPRRTFVVSTTKKKSSRPAFTIPDSQDTASTASSSTPASLSTQSSSSSRKMYPLFNKRNSPTVAPKPKVLAFSAPPRPSAPEAGG